MGGRACRVAAAVKGQAVSGPGGVAQGQCSRGGNGD
jgi:hypothetical protein